MIRSNTPVPPPQYAPAPTLAPEHVDALMPRHRHPWMTWALVATIVLVYGWQWLDPTLTERWLCVPALVREGQWWRIFTSGLLHGSPIHIAANAYFGWYIGARLERFIGPWRLLVISVAAQIGCGLAVVYFTVAPVLGFSGVLYGWLAAWLAFHLTPRFPGLRLSGPMRRAYIQTLIANLAISIIPGVSLAGHLGGFVLGFVVAFVFGMGPRPVVERTQALGGGGGQSNWT